MTVIQTVLVFVGIPLLVVVLVSLAVYGRSMAHQPNRYRPGKPWSYPAAWYVPHPDALEGTVSDRVGHNGANGTAGDAVAVGGASGEW